MSTALALLDAGGQDGSLTACKLAEALDALRQERGESQAPYLVPQVPPAPYPPIADSDGSLIP